MNNFFELLDTEFSLEITVNGQHTKSALLDPLVFRQQDTVSIDGYEVLPRYQYLAQAGKLTITEPFYQWLHRVTNQGWLLQPQPQMYRLKRTP